MKHQVLFSSKDKSKNNVSSAAILFGAIRVKILHYLNTVFFTQYTT